ncbi:MAG: class I SAM-dependent methyltransferase [Sphingomonadaceae bacterium]
MIEAIRAAIARDGPLPLARALQLAADHYYATREPFGAAGDFVTAPEISQMFGELIGLWAADLWRRAGAPPRLLLAEAGPGRGTLMADALRAARKAAPAFAAAAEVHFVERSARLMAEQAKRVPEARWHGGLDTLPADAPLILIANEFLDALPIAQFERVADGWVMRMVGPRGVQRGPGANLAFIPPPLRDAPVGSVFERGFAAEQVVSALARRLAAQGGAALIIDYGHVGPALGDTLQAIRGGAFADPIATLGEADVSAHVDFGAMAAAARPHARVLGPVAQGPFLEALGLSARAKALKRGATIERAAEIEAARARLVSVGAMGRLFQVLGLVAPGWPEPAGFPT